jgi:hypothetical protein
LLTASAWPACDVAAGGSSRQRRRSTRRLQAAERMGRSQRDGLMVPMSPYRCRGRRQNRSVTFHDSFHASALIKLVRKLQHLQAMRTGWPVNFRRRQREVAGRVAVGAQIPVPAITNLQILVGLNRCPYNMAQYERS